MKPSAPVSVVVPTCDRPARLQACLAALARQTARPREIVVVDDGAAEDPSVADLVRHAGAVLLHTRGRGPAAARNAGTVAADAPIVCFTDDDCLPAAGWLAALHDAIEGGSDVAFGRTVPARHNPFDIASQAITARLTVATPEPGRAPFGPTCNLAATRDLLASVPFDETFAEAAAEDRDWCLRAAHAGARFELVPAAVVAHDQRLSARSFARQQVRYGRGGQRLRARHPSRPRTPVAVLAALAARSFRAGFAHGFLVCAAQAAVAAGVLTEALSARRGAAR